MQVFKGTNYDSHKRKNMDFPKVIENEDNASIEYHVHRLWVISENVFKTLRLLILNKMLSSLCY